MGGTQDTLFEPEFNRSIKVETSEQSITSHAGAVLLREADHQLGFVESLALQLNDPRNPEKIRDTAAELLRERIYGHDAGEREPRRPRSPGPRSCDADGNVGSTFSSNGWPVSRRNLG